MKCAQHAAYNPKFQKMGLFRHPRYGNEKIKGPAHMVEGDHHLRKDPYPNPPMIQSNLPSASLGEEYLN